MNINNRPLIDPTSLSREAEYDGHDHSQDSETTPILGFNRSFDNGSQYGSRTRQRNNSFHTIDGFSTFLANPLASSGHEIEQSDNTTTIALNEVKNKVYKPYTYLLKLVAWEPVYPNRSLCFKVLNHAHVVLVSLVIFLGYLLQIAACFRRDSTLNADSNNTTGCEHYYVSQYIIPDIIHSLAYFYSLYIFRYQRSEQLRALIDTVFLQASPGGDLSQKQLIKDMRTILWLALTWICFSFGTMVMYVAAKDKSLMFTFLNVSDMAPRIILICLLLAGLVVLDLVYITVVINYCVQCSLLKFYFEGLIEKVTQHSVELETAIKDFGVGKRYISTLNHSSATAMSLVLFNFGTMFVLAILSFMHANSKMTTLMGVSTFLSMTNWFMVFIIPLLLAAKLTRTCRNIHSLGNEVRMRPFVFRDVDREELDSFLLFTSTLNMNARIFQIPVKYSYIFCVLVLIFFCVLLLLQTGQIHFYIGINKYD